MNFYEQLDNKRKGRINNFSYITSPALILLAIIFQIIDNYILLNVSFKIYYFIIYILGVSIILLHYLGSTYKLCNNILKILAKKNRAKHDKYFEAYIDHMRDHNMKD